MVLSKQTERKQVLQGCRKALFSRGSGTMHNWVQNLFEFCHVSHGMALLRVTASHRHYVRPKYLMYVYPSMYIKCVLCMRVRAPRHTAYGAAIEH